MFGVCTLLEKKANKFKKSNYAIAAVSVDLFPRKKKHKIIIFLEHWRFWIEKLNKRRQNHKRSTPFSYFLCYLYSCVKWMVAVGTAQTPPAKADLFSIQPEAYRFSSAYIHAKIKKKDFVFFCCFFFLFLSVLKTVFSSLFLRFVFILRRNETGTF